MPKKKPRKAPTESFDKETALAKWGNPEYDTLDEVLPHLYMKLAVIYVDATGELNPYIVEEYLPLQAFELAKACRWITPSTYGLSNTIPKGAPVPNSEEGWVDPDTSLIGPWLVNTRFKTEFYKRLEPGLSEMRKLAAVTVVWEWQKPTPAEWLRQFLDETRWTRVG